MTMPLLVGLALNAFARDEGWSVQQVGASVQTVSEHDVQWDWQVGDGWLVWTFRDPARAVGVAQRLVRDHRWTDAEAHAVATSGRLQIAVQEVLQTPASGVSRTIARRDRSVRRALKERQTEAGGVALAAVHEVVARDVRGHWWTVVRDPAGREGAPGEGLWLDGELLVERSAAAWEGEGRIEPMHAKVELALTQQDRAVDVQAAALFTFSSSTTLDGVWLSWPDDGGRNRELMSVAQVTEGKASPMRMVPDGDGAWLLLDLEAGATAQLAVSWRTTWDLPVRGTSLDPAGLQVQDWLMRLGPALHGEARWPVTLQIEGDLDVALSVSGATRKRVAEEGRTAWASRSGPVPVTPTLTLGPWEERVATGPDGTTVRAYHIAQRSADLWAFAAVTEQQLPAWVDLAGGFWPCPEVDFVPGTPGSEAVWAMDASTGRLNFDPRLAPGREHGRWHNVGCVVSAPPEALHFQALRTLDHRHGGDWLTWQLTHELGHQLWGTWVWPAVASDRWWTEALVEDAVCHHPGWPAEGCAHRLRAARRDLGNLRAHQSRTPWPWTPQTDRASRTRIFDGGLLFVHYLRERLGTDAWRAAQHALAERYGAQPVTAAALRTVAEDVSGLDLTGAFGTLAYGTGIETMTLTWRRTEAGVEGEIAVEPALGTLDVPVDVDGQRLWVTVSDGLGHLTLARAQRLKLDPDGLMVARRVRTRRPKTR